MSFQPDENKAQLHVCQRPQMFLDPGVKAANRISFGSQAANLSHSFVLILVRVFPRTETLAQGLVIHGVPRTELREMVSVTHLHYF